MLFWVWKEIIVCCHGLWAKRLSKWMTVQSHDAGRISWKMWKQQQWDKTPAVLTYWIMHKYKSQEVPRTSPWWSQVCSQLYLLLHNAMHSKHEWLTIKWSEFLAAPLLFFISVNAGWETLFGLCSLWGSCKAFFFSFFLYQGPRFLCFQQAVTAAVSFLPEQIFALFTRQLAALTFLFWEF